MLLNELVVGEVRVGLADAVDFFHLAGRQVFVWIQAPSSFEPLHQQDLSVGCSSKRAGPSRFTGYIHARILFRMSGDYKRHAWLRAR